jgi:hypothetical protein
MDLRSLIPGIASQEGVPAALLAKVINVESGGNPLARSPKGAFGPAQLMPATAKDLGVDINDPADNIRGGARYLKQQMDRFGDPRLALAAYNAGPGAVRRAGGVPNYLETQAYVGKVMGDQGGFDGSSVFGMAGQPAAQQGGFDGSAIFGGSTAAAPAPTAVPAQHVSVDQMRAFAKAPQQLPDRGPLAQFGAGAVESGLGALNNAIQVDPKTLVARGVEFLSGKMGMGLHPQAATTANAAASLAPVVGDAMAGRPQGVVSDLARTGGQMLPAALAPGSLVQKAASVALPSVGSVIGGQAAKGTPYEGAARLVGGMAGGALAGSIPTSAKSAPLPTADLAALKAAKTAAYEAVDGAGVAFKADATKSLADDIKALVKDEGGREIYPGASAMADRIASVANKGDMPFSTLDKLRSQVGEKLMSGPAAEARIGGMIRDKIDSFFDGADASTVASGDGAGAAKLVRTARDLNTRFRKVEDVTNRVASADLRASSTYSGGNVENATRQNLRPLIDPKSPQRMRNPSPDEQAALNKAVRGSAGQNAVRLAGKVLDPRGLLGSTVQATTGLASHGLAPLMTAPLGIAATELGKRMTAKNVQDLLDLMAAGGVRAPSGAAAFAARGGIPQALLPSPIIAGAALGGGLPMENVRRRTARP